jgi:hypothetical protein
MSTRTELDRLAAARPAILRRTEEVVDAAEEDRILRQILFTSAGAPAPAGVPSPVRARSLSWLTAGARAPAGPADRARRRRRQLVAFSAIAIAIAAGAVTAAAVTAAAGGMAGHVRPGTSRAQTTAYMVGHIENALANDNLVTRETTSLITGGGATFFDGRRSYQEVTWSYQGRRSTQIFGSHGQLQGVMGTGMADGKIQEIQVDYLLRQWELIPATPDSVPANACTLPGFLDVPGNQSVDWPSLIRRTLACGGYKAAGEAEIDGAETLKITGQRTMTPPFNIREVVTLFVSPSTYLPVRLTDAVLPTAGSRVSGTQTSADFQWLPPTAANSARASVTIPCGFQQISWPSGAPASVHAKTSCR